MIRLRAFSRVMPLVHTVTGPFVPAVVEWFVALNVMSTIARSFEGTTSRSTSPLVWPIPRMRVPSTVSLTEAD